LFSLEVPDRGYERRRDNRGTRGALESKDDLGGNLGNPVISNLGGTVYSYWVYILEGYRAGLCAWTRSGIRMYQSVRTKITKKGNI